MMTTANSRDTVARAHLLEDGTVPGWPIVCLLCGRMWRHGPRGSRCTR